MSASIDTAEYIRHLNLGDHISCIYRTDKELFSLIVPFFIEGLRQHNKCVYIYDEYTPDKICVIFRDSGFDLEPYILKHEFLFVSKDEIYLKNGAFETNNILENIQEMESNIKAQGYTALRITGDASWLTTHTSIVSDFMKYEAKVNNVIQDDAIIAVCQYKETLFDKQILIDVLRTHPVIYLYDKFVFCKYFAPSDDFIPMANNKSHSVSYSRIIESLYI